MSQKSSTKVIPIKSIHERNADLDAEIVTHDQLQALDAMADDILNDLEDERLLSGDYKAEFKASDYDD